MTLLGDKHWIAPTLPSQCTDYSIVQLNESNVCDKQLLGAQLRKLMYKRINAHHQEKNSLYLPLII
jgi:hypothetical protein